MGFIDSTTNAEFTYSVLNSAYGMPAAGAPPECLSSNPTDIFMFETNEIFDPVHWINSMFFEKPVGGAWRFFAQIACRSADTFGQPGGGNLYNYRFGSDPDNTECPGVVILPETLTLYNIDFNGGTIQPADWGQFGADENSPPTMTIDCELTP